MIEVMLHVEPERIGGCRVAWGEKNRGEKNRGERNHGFFQ
jgi:hypothetical protein